MPVPEANLYDGQRSIVLDGSGRFRIERSSNDPLEIMVYRTGYEGIKALRINVGENRVIMRRILSVELFNVRLRIAVGDRHSISGRVVFDTGETMTTMTRLDVWSTNPNVLKAATTNEMYQAGVAPGTAGLAGGYYGVQAAMVQVEVFKP